MLPLILTTGVTTSAEVDIETLGQRLRSATLSRNATVKYPNLIAATARVPQSASD